MTLLRHFNQSYLHPKFLTGFLSEIFQFLGVLSILLIINGIFEATTLRRWLPIRARPYGQRVDALSSGSKERKETRTNFKT